MKYILAAIAVIAPATTWADTFYTNLPVTSATVYPQGAMVTRDMTMTLPNGQHKVVAALHPSVMQSGHAKMSVNGAVQVSTGVSRITDLDFDVFLTDSQIAARDAVETQRDMIVRLHSQLTTTRSEHAALQVQARFLEQIAPSTDAPQSFEELVAISAFLPTALTENTQAQATGRAKIATLEHTIEDAQDMLAELQQRLKLADLPDEDWPVVTFTLDVTTPGDVRIFADTLSNTAGWEMSYEMYLNEDAGQIVVERAANISQNTGESWEGVNVTLSSANPTQRLIPNVPRRDVVELVVPVDKSFSRSGGLGSMDEPMMEPMVIAEVFEHAGASGSSISGSFDGVAIEYEIPNPVTLISLFEGAEQVQMPPLTLNAVVDRYASPRHDETAFVRAKITNTTGEPMLSGPAVFYREGNLIRRDKLSFIPVGGEATLHFGPDLSLPLDMRFLSEMSGDTGFITRTNTRQEQMEFEVKNIGSTKQMVTVAYALPISVEEDVQVRLDARPRPTREDVDGVQGRSEWDITLPPGGTQIFKLDVNITWPDGAEISWRP